MIQDRCELWGPAESDSKGSIFLLPSSFKFMVAEVLRSPQKVPRGFPGEPFYHIFQRLRNLQVLRETLKFQRESVSRVTLFMRLDHWCYFGHRQASRGDGGDTKNILFLVTLGRTKILQVPGTARGTVPPCRGAGGGEGLQTLIGGKWKYIIGNHWLPGGNSLLQFSKPNVDKIWYSTSYLSFDLSNTYFSWRNHFSWQNQLWFFMKIQFFEIKPNPNGLRSTSKLWIL